MAIISKRNQVWDPTNDNGNVIWFDFMEDLIAQGWRVLGSGDGNTYENTGQKPPGAAFARLVTPGPGSLLDGETFTLNDGTNPAVTFEFDKVPDGVGGGNVAVDISAATTAADVAAAIIAAVNGVGASLTIAAQAGFKGLEDPAGSAVVQFWNDTDTTATGNTATSETVANADFDIDNFEGGGVAAGGSGGAYDVISLANATLDQSSPWTTGNWGNINPFALQSRGASWRRLATPADADHYAEILFQLQFDMNPGEDASVIAVICRGAQRFNRGADHWQRPGVNTGVALRLACLRVADNPEEHVNATGRYGAFFVPSSAGGAHWWIGDKDSDYDFLFWSHRSGATELGEVFADFGRLRVEGGQERSDASADPDPYVWITGFPTTAGSTGHNWYSTTTHMRPREDNPDVLMEDLDSLSGSPPDMLISWGLDDPGVPAQWRGHYGGHFSPPANVEGTGWELLLEKQKGFGANERVLVIPLVMVCYANSSVVEAPTFIKGWIKNILLCWNLHAQNGIPQVQRPINLATDPYRVAWGWFHVYWGAEEGVDAVY